MPAKAQSLYLSANRGILLGTAGGVLRVGWSNTTTVAGVVSGGSLTIANDGQGFSPPSNVYLANAANTYTGPTTIGGGALPSNYDFGNLSTLNVAHLANGGQNSSIGASSGAASNLIFNPGSGGTANLNYSGTGDSTNRLFTIASGSAAINSSGTGPLVFTNPGAIAVTGSTPVTLDLGGSYAGSTANTFAPAITNKGALLTSLYVNGSVWMLSGSNNTFTGGTTVAAGTLIAANNEALEDGSSLFVGNDLFTFGGVIPAGASSPAVEAAASPASCAGARTGHAGAGYRLAWRRGHLSQEAAHLAPCDVQDTCRMIEAILVYRFNPVGKIFGSIRFEPLKCYLLFFNIRKHNACGLVVIALD